MANKKIKTLKLGTEEYDIHDAATALLATQNVNSINGYAYTDVNNGTVVFANTPMDTTDFDSVMQILNPVENTENLSENN